MANPTFIQLYNQPPITQWNTSTAHGSSSTSSFSPAHPAPVRLTPQHIVQDPQIAHSILTFGRNYIGNVPHPPSPGLISEGRSLQRQLLRFPSAVESNIHEIFVRLRDYCLWFVEESDALPTAITPTDCPPRFGSKPDGRGIRSNRTRLVYEFKSKAAFDAHSRGIGDLATGRGTHLTRGAHEQGARATIFKVSHSTSNDNSTGAY